MALVAENIQCMINIYNSGHQGAEVGYVFLRDTVEIKIFNFNDCYLKSDKVSGVFSPG